MKPEVETARLFVGIFPPPTSLRSILEAELTWNLRDLRPVPPEKRHLTLCFLGAVPSSEIPIIEATLIDLPYQTKHLRLQISGLGVFPNLKRPQVLWAGLQGDLEPLQSLAKNIQTACRPWIEKPETKPFHPHLTIARFRRPHREIEDILELEGRTQWGGFEASEFHLIESRPNDPGSPYLTLSTYWINKPAGS